MEKKAAVTEETVEKEPVKTSLEEASEGSRKTAKKKSSTKKTAEIKTTLCVQYLGKEVFERDLIALVKKAWTAKKNKVGDIKTIELYVKPEDNAVYYVVNGDFSGSIEI